MTKRERDRLWRWIRRQLRTWFGPGVLAASVMWVLILFALALNLATYHAPHARFLSPQEWFWYHRLMLVATAPLVFAPLNESVVKLRGAQAYLRRRAEERERHRQELKRRRAERLAEMERELGLDNYHEELGGSVR